HQFRNRLPAAFGQRARAVGEPLAAFEGAAHQRMRLETLELVERREPGIAVVQMHDEADRHEVASEMIKERAAAGAVVERPTERVLHEPGLMLFGTNFPQFLQPYSEFRGIAAAVELEAGDEELGQIPARAFRKQRVLAAKLHAAGET